ncbi:MAG: tRNA CCA-pyrophosphorylase [Candidatus Thorarchaeota archaeon]|nr:tRNA CCA-pyrophosphorylase [Candidatus Thorarchaeota archaeon]
MSSGSVKVRLVSGRTLSQGRAMEKGKITQEYEDAVAICELGSKTMEALGIENGDIIVVKAALGKINVKAKLDKNLQEGMAFIPCGPYFNYLLDAYTQLTGMPGFKSLEATINAAPGAKIPTVKEITQMMKEGVK